MTLLISSPSSVPSWLCAWRSSPGSAYETPPSSVALRVVVRPARARVDVALPPLVRQAAHVPDLIAIPQHLLVGEDAGDLHHLEQIPERRLGRVVVGIGGQEPVSHSIGVAHAAHDSPFDRAKIAASRDSSQLWPL